jgi:predicted SPOUT superfamily RNA methylase MTH1
MGQNYALKRSPKLSIAVPASFVSDVPHLREKTFKIGLIGRASAIFRVDEIIIFPDKPEQNQNRETSLIATILSYLETPQYLRKYLFKIMPELGYAGVLPPLRTPHHPLQNRIKDLKKGEYREGVVVSSDAQGTQVDIGVEQPLPVSGAHVPVNRRVTVKVLESGKHPRITLASSDEVKVYWGYKVHVSKVPFGRMVKEKRFDTIIATSRLGEPLMRIADRLVDSWKSSKHVLVAFGSPEQGLHEIVEKEKLELKTLADYIINTIPEQATQTVRTEEAVYATLATLNLLTA